MTKNYKHYTFQEYLETFSSFQDSYDYYFEMQKEIDKLSEYNLHLVKSLANYEELLCERNNRIDKAIELLKTLDEDTLSNMQLSLEIIGHIEYILKGEE